MINMGGIILALVVIFCAVGIAVGLIWLLVSTFSKKDKKIPLLVCGCSFALFIVLFFIGGAIFSDSGITDEEYESVVAVAESYSQEVDNLMDDVERLEQEKESLQHEYDSYRESMSEYEGLAIAEAESRRIQAESMAAAEQLAKEQAEAESLAAKEAEEKAGYDTGITYDQLARTPDEFKNKKVKFTGKVIQLIEGDSSNSIRFAVNSDYDNILYCEYDKDIVSTRVLEDDIITIYGSSYGLYSYQSTLGGKITIPAVIIDKIDQ